MTGPTVPGASLPPPRRGRSRVAAALGTVTVLALLLVGGALTWAGAEQRGEGGFFTTSTAPLATTTSALVTDEIDTTAQRSANPSVDLGDLARIRIRAATTNPSDAVFIGIGPTQDVENYLHGTGYDEMASYDVNPLRVTYDRSPGHDRPAPPGAQQFWVASTTGTGALSLQWDKRGGAWTAVAMNADGRPGVTVTAADLGLRFAFLLPLGIGLLAGGLLLATTLLASTLRAGRRRAGVF